MNGKANGLKIIFIDVEEAPALIEEVASFRFRFDLGDLPLVGKANFTICRDGKGLTVCIVPAGIGA